jgi:ribonuclease HI
MTVKLYVDGGTRGMVICLHDPQRDKTIVKRRPGASTNNDLEYIEYAKKYYPRDEIVIHSDSKLAVNQINGEYKVNGENLIKLHNKALRKLNSHIHVKWVRRNFNPAGIHLEASADKLK